MENIIYKFSDIQNSRNTDYIFQLVKNRKLSQIYHSHDFYEIIYFLQGKAVQTINGTLYDCSANSIVLLRPGDRHYFLSQSSDAVVVSVSVACREFEDLCAFYGREHLNPIICSDNPILCENCSFFSLSFFEKISAINNDVDCKFLLSNILHYYAKLNYNQTDIPDSLAFAVDEMKKTENLREGITAFTRLSNYSQSHLARMMKTHFNTTPKKHINELRLQKAYNCIVFTQKPTELIAQELGFESYSHFNKIFKKRFSVTPIYLRKHKEIWTV